jgi:hypothetical protein
MVPAVDIDARYPSRLYQSQGWLVGGLSHGSVEVSQGAQRDVQRGVSRGGTRPAESATVSMWVRMVLRAAWEAVDAVGGRIAVSGGVDDR